MTYYANIKENPVAVYSTVAELPLTDVVAGSQAYINSTNRLYLYTGAGWFNVALINTSPTITQGAASAYPLATNGTPTVITLLATDPEGIPITWSYTVTSGSLTNGGGATATVTQNNNVFTITPTTNSLYVGIFGLTFTASDGVNLATSASTFVLTFGIADSRYTSLLVKASGNGSTNKTFVDSSTNALTVTPTGDVCQGAFSPYAFPAGVDHDGPYDPAVNGGSCYFDGTGDYLLIADTPSLNFGTGDFTIEGWVNPTSLSNSPMVYAKVDAVASAPDNGWFIEFGATGTMIFGYGTSSAVYYLTTSASFTTGTWQHMACIRQGSQVTVYRNGVSIGTKALPDALSHDKAVPIYIGRYATQTTNDYSGYIEDLRITKGLARYTANFTPSTAPLTAIADTQLLLNFTNGGIVDYSQNNNLRLFGNVVSSTTQSKFGESSVYFDGTGDYVTIPLNPALQFGTGNFTVELWAYLDSTKTTSQGLVNNYTTWGLGALGLFAGHQSGTANKYQVSYNGSGFPSLNSTSNIIRDAWHHIALVRLAGTITLYLNGVSQGSFTGSAALNGVAQWTIGTAGDEPLLNYVKGYIQDLRVTKGLARYTTNFTPPASTLLG